MGDEAVGVVVPLVVQGVAELLEVGIAGAADEGVVKFPLSVEVAAHLRRFLFIQRKRPNKLECYISKGRKRSEGTNALAYWLHS